MMSCTVNCGDHEPSSMAWQIFPLLLTLQCTMESTKRTIGATDGKAGGKAMESSKVAPS